MTEVTSKDRSPTPRLDLIRRLWEAQLDDLPESVKRTMAEAATELETTSAHETAVKAPAEYRERVRAIIEQGLAMYGRPRGIKHGAEADEWLRSLYSDSVTEVTSNLLRELEDVQIYLAEHGTPDMGYDEVVGRAIAALKDSAHETEPDAVLCRIHRELARGHSSAALQVVAAALEHRPPPTCAACDVTEGMPVINASFEKAGAPETLAEDSPELRDECGIPRDPSL